jgi:hypothetical protein
VNQRRSNERQNRQPVDLHKPLIAKEDQTEMAKHCALPRARPQLKIPYRMWVTARTTNPERRAQTRLFPFHRAL